MSFRTSCPSTSSAFQLVRDSLLQAAGLPFSDALSAEHIEQAFQAEGVSFAREGGAGNEPVYTPAVTLWAMLSQALFTGEERSCQAAVARVVLFYAVTGRLVSSTNTGAYCRARDQVTTGVVQRLAEGMAERCEAAAPEELKWLGRTVYLADGTTHSMPDTKENQAEYPQSSSQAEGLGFPLLRAVALVSLATGLIQGLAVGPYAGKETGETALLRSLFHHLQAGDVILADRYHGGWFMLALFRELGVDFVVRLHQLRTADFSRGRRLGNGDHVVSWAKPVKPEWLDQETYNRLPAELEVREVQVNVAIPGFRTESLVVVTSLLDPQEVSAKAVADLYRERWHVELHLRDIKTMMQLDVLRRKTPERVRQELWTGLLAYNLIRQSMLQSAAVKRCRPRTLSFTASLQMLANQWLIAATLPSRSSAHARMVTVRLINGCAHRVGNRSDRVEPRAVKRRPAPLALLTVPRQQARQALLAGITDK
ncbi:MAG: transposase family protein [Planctomycetaceae bacterium]|nr:transposase family protein [Planctomycetaceae bacterium]